MDCDAQVIGSANGRETLVNPLVRAWSKVEEEEGRRESFLEMGSWKSEGVEEGESFLMEPPQVVQLWLVVVAAAEELNGASDSGSWKGLFSIISNSCRSLSLSDFSLCESFSAWE